MQITRSSILIRKIIIDPPLLLAPMAGLTHSALRRAIAGFGGVGLLATEMLSAKKLPRENPRISPYLIRTDAEKLLSYQLLIASADEAGPALDALHRFGADVVDINMGCPAPAVGRFGAGIGLMERPQEVRRLVAETRKRTALPLTAKIRIGIDQKDDGMLADFCAMLQDEGIDLVSVHARLKHESFAREPRWESIGAVKQRLTVPVVANGGIFSVEDANKCLDRSGADGLMIGRAAAIKPWLFAEIGREVFGAELAAPVVSLLSLYAGFIRDLTELFRPAYRLGRLKEFTHYFARNYKFGHHLASRIQSSATMDEARERAEQFFAANAS